MSLATRLSSFFLIALALVLAGFSGTLYLLTKTDLVKQNDERLERALETLEASVDIEPGGLEWEPSDRHLTLGADPSVDAVRWAVRDGRGTLVDRSSNSKPGDFPLGWSLDAGPRKERNGAVFGSVPGWRLAGRRLRLDELLRQGRGHPDDEPGYEVQYPILDLVVGMSPAPVEATLARLRMTLGVLSVAVWISAAAVGRWLCLRALAPMRRMANAMTAMTAADLGRRLPRPGTGDELDELGQAFNDLQDRLHEAFARLNEAYEQQRRFAGDASHQLRTPLAALLGQVQVVRRRDRSPEEYRRVLDLVQAEGVRLRQIVDSLLFLANPNGSRPDPQPLDLAAWAPEHLGRWSAHTRAADLRHEIAAPSPLIVRVHEALLAQLVDNLLENACKYSTPGSPIVVRVGRDGSSATLAVEDRGQGLAAEDLARVFEPFYRTEEARRNGQGGVGLGLAVARRIAAAFGGSLIAQSVPEAGTRFVLRLPEDRTPSTWNEGVDSDSTTEEPVRIP